MVFKSEESIRTEKAIKFERIVTSLLTKCRQIGNQQFELKSDHEIPDSLPYSEKIGKINIKLRDNGCKSQPDAELISILNDLYIVVDAKFYSTELKKEDVQKTIDDMNLRKAYGLIVCSEATILT